MHFIDNVTISENCTDPYKEVRLLIDILQRTFANAASSTEFSAIDEMIIPFKGRNRSKQYIKNKPKKWGFKVWVHASANGYVSKFEMYEKADKSKVTDLGVIGDTVVRLCNGLEC